MSEPVAWRVVTDQGDMLFNCKNEALGYCAESEALEPLYLSDEIERKDAAIAELTARAIDCEMSWKTERAERAELAIAELAGALKYTLDGLVSDREDINVRATLAKYDTPKEPL